VLDVWAVLPSFQRDGLPVLGVHSDAQAPQHPQRLLRCHIRCLQLQGRAGCMCVRCTQHRQRRWRHGVDSSMSRRCFIQRHRQVPVSHFPVIPGLLAEPLRARLQRDAGGGGGSWKRHIAGLLAAVLRRRQLQVGAVGPIFQPHLPPRLGIGAQQLVAACRVWGSRFTGAIAGSRIPQRT
jgi:hypothetical protein